MHDRSLPVALAVCLAAAGTPLHLANAQSTGNPVDQLPSARSTTGRSDATVRILPPPQPGPAGQTRAVTPLKFEIEGVRSIAFEEVAALFKPLAGQPTTVAKLNEVARQATALYQRAGYALSFCFLPEQDFAQGLVRVVAVEGHIDKVTMEGDAGASGDRLRELAERIRADRPLRLATFERYTQLMAALPGVDVEARATPPAMTDGAGSLLLKVTREPYSVSVGTDVRSSRLRAVVTGVVNDPIVAGGRLSASTLVGANAGEAFLAAGYSQAVGSDGLTLKAELSLYRGDPDAQLEHKPAIARFTTYRRAELSASYPLKLTRSETLFLSGGLYGTHNADEYENPASGARLTDEVNARAVYLQAAWNQANEERARSLSLRLTHGIDGLGASSAITSNRPGQLPRNPARLDFARVLLEGGQRNVWGKKWGTSLSFATQYSPHSVPSSERVSFGSTRFGRAYLAGEIAGDSGWGVGAEVNRSFALDTTWVKQLQPYLLLEAAAISSHAGTPAFSRLGSVSVGLRVSDRNYYSVDIALSKPTGDASPDNPQRKLRLSTQLSYNFEKKR